MSTLNSSLINRERRGINKLIEKYGHACTVVTGSNTVSTKVLFGKYTVKLSGGSLVLNNNYKLIIKVVEGMAIPQPTITTVNVNGVALTALAVRRNAPSGSTVITYEIEAAGSDVPADVTTIVTPTVVTPANNTADYAYTTNTGSDYSATFTASAFVVENGTATYVSSDWQVSELADFSTIKTSVSGYTGGLSWTTTEVLERNKVYYVRVRHNGSIGTSAWSSGNRWSFDSLTPTPTVHINKPSITNILTGGVLSYPEGRSDSYGGKYLPYLTLSTYSPVDAGASASTYWQIATDSAFTNLVLNQTSVEGYNFDGTVVTRGMLGVNDSADCPCLGSTTYYARGKWVSVDPYESEYSDTFEFKVTA